ncbi:MAG: FAD-dependent oxidoreductase, partial [Vulcanococcus sp.]
MLRLNELKLPLDHSDSDLREAICRRLRLQPPQLHSQRLVKRSIDARRRDAIQFIYSVELELDPELEQQLL